MVSLETSALLNPARADTPLVDPSNPLWVPDVPAAEFLEEIKVKNAKEDRRLSAAELAARIKHSFVRQLTKNLDSGLILSSDPFANSYTTTDSSFTDPLPPRRIFVDLALSSPARSSRERRTSKRHSRSVRGISDRKNRDRTTVLRAELEKVKEREAELEDRCNFLAGKTAHTCSYNCIYAHASEDVLPETVQEQAIYLYGPECGAESPSSLAPFIKRLYRLCRLPYLEECKTHEELSSYLGEEGRLDSSCLNMFRATGITRLSLSNSLTRQSEDNTFAMYETLAVLGRPNSFQSVRELDLSNVTLDDLRMTDFHHLPAIEKLWLNNTGISSQAVCHLVAMQRNLQHLHIQRNSLIDDESIPSLGFLRLSLLDLHGTSVSISGIRKLAGTIARDGRQMEVGLPAACQEYLSNLDTQYLVNPEPPLIRSSTAAYTLTIAALKANLNAHSACDSRIVATGTKHEMAVRLRGILERREQDAVVRDVFGLNEMELDAVEAEDVEEAEMAEAQLDREEDAVLAAEDMDQD